MLAFIALALLGAVTATPTPTGLKPAAVDPNCPGHHRVYTVLTNIKSATPLCKYYFGANTTKTSTTTVTPVLATSYITSYSSIPTSPSACPTSPLGPVVTGPAVPKVLQSFPEQNVLAGCQCVVGAALTTTITSMKTSTASISITSTTILTTTLPTPFYLQADTGLYAAGFYEDLNTADNDDEGLIFTNATNINQASTFYIDVYNQLRTPPPPGGVAVGDWIALYSPHFPNSNLARLYLDTVSYLNNDGGTSFIPMCCGVDADGALDCNGALAIYNGGDNVVYAGTSANATYAEQQNPSLIPAGFSIVPMGATA